MSSKLRNVTWGHVGKESWASRKSWGENRQNKNFCPKKKWEEKIYRILKQRKMIPRRSKKQKNHRLETKRQQQKQLRTSRCDFASYLLTHFQVVSSGTILPESTRSSFVLFPFPHGKSWWPDLSPQRLLHKTKEATTWFLKWVSKTPC